ncbi:component of SufBCD complex [Haematobacter genomosp. 1]|uniref:component of SufBCD complex n=1 Tax=Haematobacter genomosp. 1 TaxID=366618 RepID=UPI0015C58B30|nr:component of SufBCD complex [Haematobacter genomosp. 1]
MTALLLAAPCLPRRTVHLKGRIRGNAAIRCGNRREARPSDVLNWYSMLAGLIDVRSFSSLWFWVMLAVMWFLLGQRVAGVPVDVIAAAHADRPGSMAELEEASRLSALRLVRRHAALGLLTVATAFFLLSSLLIAGWGYGIELGQALFLLILPLTLVRGLDLWTAQQILSRGLAGENLRSALFWQRFRVQCFGIVFILATALWGMWRNLTVSALGS